MCRISSFDSSCSLVSIWWSSHAFKLRSRIVVPVSEQINMHQTFDRLIVKCVRARTNTHSPKNSQKTHLIFTQSYEWINVSDMKLIGINWRHLRSFSFRNWTNTEQQLGDMKFTWFWRFFLFFISFSEILEIQESPRIEFTIGKESSNERHQRVVVRVITGE